MADECEHITDLVIDQDDIPTITYLMTNVMQMSVYRDYVSKGWVLYWEEEYYDVPWPAECPPTVIEAVRVVVEAQKAKDAA